MDKFIVGLVTWLVAGFLAAFDTGMFYLIVSLVLSTAVTWPVVLAVFWVTQTVYSIGIKTEMRRQGYLG